MTPRTLIRTGVAGLALVALGAPIVLAAAGMNAFTNGTVADATAVNANFSNLDGRVTTLETRTRGDVVAMAAVQTRVQTTYTAPISGDGTEITPLRITMTPKKAGNQVVLEWVVNGEMHYNAVYVVTRNGVKLAETTNAGNSMWAGVTAQPYDVDVASTPDNAVVKIVDMDSLAVPTTYELRVRSSTTSALTMYLNRTVNSMGADSQEAGLSVGTATEIWW